MTSSPIQAQLAQAPGGIFFLADAPGDEDVIKGYPFCGSDGFLLSRALRSAGMVEAGELPSGLSSPLPAETRRLLWERRAHSFSTVLTTQPSGPVKPEDLPCEVGERIVAQLRQTQPNLIVPMGPLALWLLTGETSIDAWRGAVRSVPATAPIMSGSTGDPTDFIRALKVLPTIDPGNVLKWYKLLVPLLADLAKIKHEAAFPEIRQQEVAIWIEPDLDDLAKFEREHINGADILTVDIETAVGQIVCVQVGTSDSTVLVLPFVDFRQPSRSYWATAEEELAAWAWLERILNLPTAKLGQNFAAYDTYWLLDRVGIPVRNRRHDLRLLHHILQPELPKSLSYLGALYTALPRWKTNHKGSFTGGLKGGTDAKRDS